jgi:hypothetical protein
MNNDDVPEELAGNVSHWFLSEEQAGESKLVADGVEYDLPNGFSQRLYNKIVDK